MKRIFAIGVLLAAAAAFAASEVTPAKAESVSPVRAQKQADARAKRMVAQALEMLKEGEEARGVATLEAVAKMFPESDWRFRSWLELGRQHLGKSRYDEARAMLRKAQGADEAAVKAEALLLQAKVEGGAGRDGEASMLLRRVTSDFPDSPFANDAWFEIGQIHFKAKRWVRAQEAFRRVGTAVPRAAAKDDGAASSVLAEAGQRLFVCVEDRDIAVALALGTPVRATVRAASGDSETLTLAPYGQDGIAALASVPTSSDVSKPDDGVLTVHGGEVVSVEYVDAANGSGARNVPVKTTVKIVSSAVLAVMDGAYRQSVKGVFVGNPAFLRLRDLDLDLGAGRDKTSVSVTSYRKRPKPTPEEIAEAAAKGETADADADPWIELGSAEVELVETAPRSGVFEGRVTPVLGEAGAGEIAAAADGRLVFRYTDRLHVGGTLPNEVVCEVAVLTGGSTEPQSIVSNASDPALQARKLLLEARLLLKWGSIFKDVGLDGQANEKADEGLRRIADVFALAARQAVDREVTESAYAVKWDLLLVKGELDKAIGVCRELLRNHPDTVLADLAFIRIAKARGESREPKDLEAAAKIYRSVLSMPNSANRPEAQFLLASILEKSAKMRATKDRPADYTAAIAAYRACAENYPQSAFAGESFKRIVTYQIENKDYERATETLERVFQDYPDAPWLDEMLLRWGIVNYRSGNTGGAAEKFRRVLEEYPSGSAAAQATSFLARLGKSAE